MTSSSPDLFLAVSDFPRLGLFARWHHKDWETMRWDKGGIRSNGDLWKYWADEVREVAPAAAEPQGEAAKL